jgi:hypothetical protein
MSIRNKFAQLTGQNIEENKEGSENQNNSIYEKHKEFVKKMEVDPVEIEKPIEKPIEPVIEKTIEPVKPKKFKPKTNAGSFLDLVNQDSQTAKTHDQIEKAKEFEQQFDYENGKQDPSNQEQPGQDPSNQEQPIQDPEPKLRAKNPLHPKKTAKATVSTLDFIVPPLTAFLNDDLGNVQDYKNTPEDTNYLLELWEDAFESLAFHPSPMWGAVLGVLTIYGPSLGVGIFGKIMNLFSKNQNVLTAKQKQQFNHANDQFKKEKEKQNPGNQEQPGKDPEKKNKCLWCGEVIEPGKKFCNRSHSAKYTNSKRGKGRKVNA